MDGRSISNITGIEGFNSLKKLVINSNKLTVLNLSKNIYLNVLDVTYNQLTSLDVSNNIYLTWLQCQSNPLTCIKVNQNQLDKIPLNWVKDPEDTYLLDCN